MQIFEGVLAPAKRFADQARRKAEQWKSGVVLGYSTGFPSLDEYTRLVGGQLYVLAARPSQGKTALGMQMAEHVAWILQQDREKAMQSGGDPNTGLVAIFSAEMSGWSLMARMGAAMAGVNMHQMSMGRGSPEDFGHFENALATLGKLPIWIDDSSGPTTQKMLKSLEIVQEDQKVALMVFDFMELGGDKGQNESLRLGEISHNLKALAKTLDIPVVAISQLNRDVETRKNKMPSLADLRYSGMIEQLADVVIFITRPQYYIERGLQVDCDPDDREGVAYIQIAKNRNGPVGLVKLAFVADRVKFAEMPAYGELLI